MEQLWKSFSESRLIITDRLHGMIFAYITKTPAIVLPNSNFKITGCYEWIKECGYIKMVDNSDFEEEIRRLLSMDASCYPLQNLKKYFDFIYSESNASED